MHQFSRKTPGIISGLTVLALVSLACGSASPSQVATAIPVTSVTTIVGEASVVAPTDAAPTAVPTAEPTPAKTTFALGEVINLDGLNLLVAGWEVLAPGEFSKPAAGNQFIGVDLVVVNASTTYQSFSSFSTSVKDATSQQYDSSFGAVATLGVRSLSGGGLAPGEKLRGIVGFEVPESAGALTFVYDAALFGFGKLFVELGDAPTAAEVPAMLPGEQPLVTSATGEAFVLDGVEIVVNDVRAVEADGYSAPAAGFRYLVVDLTLTNTTDAPTTVSSLLQMELVDPATGYRYTIDIGATVAAKGNAPDGELAAGEKLRGQVGFAVPVDAQGLRFAIDASSIVAPARIFVALP